MTDGYAAEPNIGAAKSNCFYATPEYVPYEKPDVTCNITVKVLPGKFTCGQVLLFLEFIIFISVVDSLKLLKTL